MWYLLYTYKVTAELAHALYYVTDVDYNLIIKFSYYWGCKVSHSYKIECRLKLTCAW